jgi:hypothetical protein
MSPGFDRIHLDQGDGPREVTLDEFLQIPLYRRVQLILQKQVSFSLAGQKVEIRKALKDMRTLLSNSESDPKRGP